MSRITGHLRLNRFTVQERDEQKKREKELGRQVAKTAEEEVDRSGWAKYTLGLKHQVTRPRVRVGQVHARAKTPGNQTQGQGGPSTR